MSLIDYLYVESYLQLFLLAAIVFIAGIARGCIGFGFSALVVASTSFWLEIKYVAVTMIVLEVVASLFMLKNVKAEIDYKMLKMLIFFGVIGSVTGVWVLANVNSTLHQLILSCYLLGIVFVSLLRFEFKLPLNNLRLFLISIVGGFYNGFAAIGGIFVASMLTSSKVQIKNIRATMVVYFFIIEIAFFISANYHGLYTKEVFFTSLVLIIPMLLGIIMGARLFTRLPEKTLKIIVLSSLLVLSIIGLIKLV